MYQQSHIETQRLKLYSLVLQDISSHNISTLFLAKESGVCHSTIRKWVTEETLNPRVETLVKVATSLGYNVQMVIK